MSSLSTDFNVSPYFDDYDEAKNFYRILFRPSVPVQARELTQLQTLAQKQIQRFGDHVFKDGAVVAGCTPTELPNLDFVRVSDSFSANANAFVTDITSDYLLVGLTSNVRAVAVITKEGTLLDYPDTNRFYVKYLTTGVNSNTKFQSGETINIYTSSQDKLGALNPSYLVNNIAVITANLTVNATGQGYGMRIEDGIVYQKGFFQAVEDQFVLVRDYDQSTGNTVVGFETSEEIITENTDETLLDNALGYSNENAPGAHRLKLTPTLVAKDRTDIANNDTFFAVFEFSNISGRLVLNKTKTPYETLGEIFDKRTYDESGDYVVKPFLVETITGSTSNTFYYQISPGKGYVHGSQIEYLAARSIETDRAITTANATEQVITTNYGNYVTVDEYSGVLDFSNFVTVDLYDTAFDAITNRHTVSLAGKTKIGEAKVKAVLHDEGDPGLPATTYRIYLTDIVMNSGNSFSTHVKSIYKSSAYGSFYADMVLQGSRAILEQSGKTTLVFPFGKKAVKTLSYDGGTSFDTSFYFRVTSNATMATDGTISISTPSSYTGGIDTVGYSTGVLGDTLEDEFIVVAGANVGTANITGTCVTNTANLYVTITNANNYFAPGEFIRLHSDGVTTEYRRVTASNTTVVVVDAFPSVTNAAANFGKHYPAGYTWPLDNSTYPGTRQVNVTGTTSFTVNTGASSPATLQSTAAVYVQYRMRRTSAKAARKDVNKSRYVKLLANASSNNSWNLGLPDVYNVQAVYANASGYATNSTDDVTSYFTLDNGMRDDYYDHSRLVLKPQYVGSFTNEYFVVKLDHFVANLTSSVGFMSVDSYPIDDANTANTSAIQTAQIPVYTSGSNTYDLRDCVDFRAYKANTANSATTLADASINPATTNTFISYAAAYLAEPDTNFTSDVEYYLGRIDLVTMNSTGGLGVIKGTPSEAPRVPANDSDSMLLAVAAVPPYPTLTVREAESYRRLDYATRTRLATNRGYTMRDIGVLDQRIQRLEYYTTLNLLEQKAQNIQVPDDNGLNRFKNGIFADPMSSHIYGATTDIEYRWSIDSGYGYGRPLFTSENVDLAWNNSSSTGVQLTGRVLTRPYTHELFIYQPFATKFRNNTQDLWSWKGSVELYPNYDMNRDETRLPNIDATLDLTQPFLDFAEVVSEATGSTVFGTRFGDWRTVSQNRQTNWGWGSITTTTTSQQSRTSTNTFIVPVSEVIDLGKYVTDVSVQPYMKSRTIAFIARNLKPNTRIYAYFDDEPVSEYCAPGTLNTALGATLTAIYEAAAASGKPDNVLTRTDAYGSALTTDQYGTLYGLFRIPEGTFRTGDRQFQLLDSDSLITGSDAAITRASAVFTASNISISTRNATVSALEPSINQQSFTDNRTVVNRSTQFIGMDEPIAQSFKIEAPEQQSGVFVTKIDLFFKSKDPNLGIKIVLVGMNNGVPESTRVYGTSRLESSNVVVSDTAANASTFAFNQPIFLSADKEYAFYVEPEGGSPEYKMWMAEAGGFDVITNAQVYMNPYTGDAFRSSNARTWTVLPKEDVKFNLYVANFTVGTGTAYFNNEADEYITYTGLALANSSVPVNVGYDVFLINSASNTSISNTSVKGIVQFIDTTNGKIKIDSSNGGFAAANTIGIFHCPEQSNNSQANSNTLIATATISTIDNPVLHAIVPRFATSVPLGTTIDFSFKGTSNSAVADTGYFDLSLDNEREMLDNERRVYSKSNEDTLATGKTLTIKATMTSTNRYLSPVIDLSRKSALLIKNIVSNTAATTNEHTRYGTALAKYVGQPIVLEDGQEAEDLIIYLSAYRPYNTDVEVYVKFHNNEDPAALDSKVWTKLTNDNSDLRCSPIDPFDFKEYKYTVPFTAPVTYGAYRNTSNFDIVQYEDANGAIYRTYKTFAIKIVLTSENGIFVPKINDLRGIALQV